MSEVQTNADAMYAEPFYQTVILTSKPLDPVASRLIVDAASVAMEGIDVERRMVLMTPLKERVVTPDWKPETLQTVLGAATEVPEGTLPPLIEVTGGPEITVAELKGRMHQLIAKGSRELERAQKLLIEENSLHNARSALQRAMTAWAQADMMNVRLYGIQIEKMRAEQESSE